MAKKKKPKTVSNTESADLTDEVEVFGDPDRWQLICKVYNAREGWMKSTKALAIRDVGCLVQVTTQQENPDGSYAIAEALTFVPEAKVEIVFGATRGHVVGRTLEKNT